MDQSLSEEQLEEFNNIFQKHQYQIVKLIGQGGYGAVFHVRSLKYNSDFAAKRCKISEEEKSDGMVEIEALMKLDHPNIIAIYEYFIEDNYLYLILEYCSGGSLQSKIEQNGPLLPVMIQNIGVQVIHALLTCHQMNIAHSDIKPGNILIDQFGRAKLADFGISRQVLTDQKIQQNVGTLAFLPPEALLKHPSSPFSADVYALGVTFYYLASGKLPYGNVHSKNALISAILQHDIQPLENQPPELISLIGKMIEYSCDLRIKANELLDHPFFSLQFLKATPSRKSSFLSNSSLKLSTTNLLLPKSQSTANMDDPILVANTHVSSYHHLGVKPSSGRFQRKKTLPKIGTFLE